MTIDPRLYQKYTGRMPGDAMNRYGESLAKNARRGRPGDTSFMGSVMRGRMYVRLGAAIAGLGFVVWLLFGSNLF